MLELGGFTPLSTVDWPDRLTATAFVQGCPWRCGYCHNPALQSRHPEGAGPSWHWVRQWLTRRVGLLDGLVFSGGEPCTSAGLGDAVLEVQALGLDVGLHTAGIYPRRLATLLPALAWVGFDLKTDFAHYDALTQRRHSAVAVQASLAHLLASGVDHEIRTTYHPALISDASLRRCAHALHDLGVSHWVLQRWLAPDGQSTDLTLRWRWPPDALLQELQATGLNITLR